MAAAVASATQALSGEVIEHLRRHHVMTLATASFTGIPHADTVVYVNDANCIYFFAAEGRRMQRNLNDSRRVSFTVDDYSVDWRVVRELKGVGNCLPATDEQDAHAWALYLSKFGPESVRPAGILHVIVPTEMHFVDHDYAVVTGEQTQIRRTYQLDDPHSRRSQGAVATNLQRSSYEPGQTIFEPGDSIGEYYVVVEGVVEIRGEGHGSDQTVLRLGPGQFFGDQAALRGQQGALTCHAVTDVVLLAVDPMALRDLLEAGPR